MSRIIFGVMREVACEWVHSTKSVRGGTHAWLRRRAIAMMGPLVVFGIIQTLALAQARPNAGTRALSGRHSATRPAPAGPVHKRPHAATPSINTVEVTDNWTDKTGDGLWNTPGNWDNGVPNNGNGIIYDVHVTNINFVTQDISATINNLKIDAGAEDVLGDGIILEIDGSGFTDNGQLDLASSGSGKAELSIVGDVTLTGNGLVNMTDVVTSTIGGSGTLTNQLTSSQGIQGSGFLGDGNLNLQNFGTINALGPKIPLVIKPNSVGMLNAGVMEGTTGQLQLAAGTVTNTNSASIQGSVLLLDGSTVSGGTLGSPGGQVATQTGTVNLQDLTILGLYIGDNALTNLKGTITDEGKISVTSGEIFANGATLAGTGTVVLGPGASMAGVSVVNKSSIVLNGGTASVPPATINVGTFNNQATINAAPANILPIIQPGSGGFFNTGTLGGGPGWLDIGGTTGGVITNFAGSTNGLINGSVQLTGGVTIQGGVLDGINVVQISALDGAANGGEIDVFNGGLLTLINTLINNGTLKMTAMNCNPCSQATAQINGILTLTGTGFWYLEGGNGFTPAITGAPGQSNTLISGITIQGTGFIGDPIPGSKITGNPMNFVNAAKGVVNANSSLPLIISMVTGNSFTNQGLLSVAANPGSAPSVLTIKGPFKNFKSTTGTLTGGSYNISGTLQFDNANIRNNASKLTLAGQILDQNNANALLNFANNTATGSLTVLPQTFGANFTSAGPFSNAGKVTITKGVAFVVGGSGTNYNQTGGTTTVDGRLAVPLGGLVNITGGTLQGGGALPAGSTITGSVSVGNASSTAATFIIGDSVKKSGLIAVANNYTQLAAGVMDVQIGGTTPGTKYSQLNITGTATLTGTLNIKLTSSFKPTVGQTFTILNASTGVTGTFSVVNGTSINSNEHFSVSYTPTTVVLTVVSGAVPQDQNLLAVR